MGFVVASSDANEALVRQLHRCEFLDAASTDHRSTVSTAIARRLRITERVELLLADYRL